jgi:hypothetical protein|tara:strand:+ start:8596 stop:8913 length:318 start_codon:yes stop_codon:yes gene_type:complete
MSSARMPGARATNIWRHWTMTDGTNERFGLKPRRLVADSAYESASNLAWLVKERQIDPHTLIFDAKQDHYTCPCGKLLVEFRGSMRPRTGRRLAWGGLVVWPVGT